MKRFGMFLLAFLLVFSVEAAKKGKKTTDRDKAKTAKRKRADAFARPCGWFPSISAAQTTARQQHLPILIVISGPEWNQKSKLMEQNTVRVSSFQKSVMKKAVPVYLKVPEKNVPAGLLAELKKCTFYHDRVPCVALVSPSMKLLSKPKNFTVASINQAISEATKKMPRK